MLCCQVHRESAALSFKRTNKRNKTKKLSLFKHTAVIKIKPKFILKFGGVGLKYFNYDLSWLEKTLVSKS